MNEDLYWYRTHSGLRPADYVFYINFRYVALPREALPYEIDKMALVELGQMTRSRFEKEVLHP